MVKYNLYEIILYKEKFQMEEKKTTPKKHSHAYNGLVKTLTTAGIRNSIIIFLFVASVLIMFMLDEYNDLIIKYLPALQSNFVKDLMHWLGIHQFNVGIDTWIMFGVLFIIFGVLIIGGMFTKKFVAARMKKADLDAFKSEKSAMRFYRFIWYVILLGISGLIIFAYVMLGGFDRFNPESQNIFLNLVWSLLILIGLIFAFIIALFLVFFIIETIIALIVWIIKFLMALASDVGVERRNKTEEIIQAIHETRSQPQIAPDYDIFPALTAIDNENKDGIVPTASESITLEDFILQFQSFAINKHKIYYELPTLRAFIAGLASSRLIILEGLSGTGKSMLPRMFAEFISHKAFFAPVQATWRDKTDLLGFYSEFTKTFKTTDFLKNVYAASYTDKINLCVLDEMNISRIEYYFADFLSILEYPSEDWKVKVIEPQTEQYLPAKLTDGYLTVPTNTWFIGTANTDDSTFTITDKVYDRAIILDFKEKISPIESDYSSDPIEISANDMLALFEEAQADEDLCLNKDDLNKFIKLCDYVKEAFDINFGNRIMVQIENFVPVYVALGGTKEEALDYMFARKIFRKLNGMFEDYIKDNLVALQKLIHSVYGKGVFKETEHLIEKNIKRLV